jgi:aryl-alcohol dehydrogenase-like predicted oxidoreductase/histidinol phosphatase-like enzyme/predicted kinase
MPGTALALGCMRLSTAADRDDTRSLRFLHRAFDLGFTLLDTADAYARDAAEAGHNERLIAQALETWPGDPSGITVATKGALVRAEGRWVADGRARHLRVACEASRRALGGKRLALYQLHAPDPKTPLSTSVRALQALRRDGLVEAVGLCNVSRKQLEEALRLGSLASVQVELSFWRPAALSRGGVIERCLREGIRVLAYRPLGGPDRLGRASTDATLREVAARHGDATPAEVALAWIRDLSPGIVPLPGATRPESLASIVRASRLELSDQDREQLDERAPAGRALRSPPSHRSSRTRAAAAARSEGEVVLIMGLPGAGKSRLADGFVAQGYQRLNRDLRGGRLASLLPALDEHLSMGRCRVVLDNTYVTRRSRAEVVARAAARGVATRCVFVQVSLEEAQVNAVGRMLDRYGRLLDKAECLKAAKSDPGAFGPSVQYRYARDLEAPDPSEGFAAIDVVPFRRELDPSFQNAATLLWLDGIVWKSRAGQRTPTSPDDLELAAGFREAVARHAAAGRRIFGLSWQPEVAAGQRTPAEVLALGARLRERLGTEIELRYCPHAPGPPECWCRKPLPGLAVELVWRHRLDPVRCTYVGQGGLDRRFARPLGFVYLDPAAFLEVPRVIGVPPN